MLPQRRHHDIAFPPSLLYPEDGLNNHTPLAKYVNVLT